MKTIRKKFELQIDEKPFGYVVRLNDEKGCILRICQIPKEIIENNEFIDVIYNKPTSYEYITVQSTLNKKSNENTV